MNIKFGHFWSQNRPDQYGKTNSVINELDFFQDYFFVKQQLKRTPGENVVIEQ